jgi:UDP-2,3-diacylglucosamine hydrolase
MATLFISDLHLDASHPQLTNLFLIFLKTHAKSADALYILGDLFEIWLGDDEPSEFAVIIQQALHEHITTNQIPTYFLPGNRDFLVGKTFAQQTGIVLLSDPTIINLYGEPVLIKHGDDLCTQDSRHQYFRRISRNFLVKKAFLTLPCSIREKMGAKIRLASQKRSPTLIPEKMDVTPEVIPKLMQQHQVYQFIHGHTHQPAIIYFPLHDRLANRIVLSDWGNNGNFLKVEPDGSKRLIYFDHTGKPL